MASAPATTPPSTDGGRPGITHFNFHHRVFASPGAKFKLYGRDRRPVFSIDVGKVEGIIELIALCREFGIDADSHDGRLIKLARDGLQFVPDIKPGDAMPSELLTGEASWNVRDTHVRIAHERLQIQLVSWLSGRELLLTDPREITLYIEQLENRGRVKAAFERAAAALGLGSDTEEVVRRLELLTRELSYIEALRDRFTAVQRLERRIADLIQTYGADRVSKTEVHRIWQLVKQGMSEFEAIFGDIDAQTGEIIAALKGIDRQIKYIRTVRDGLHQKFKEWGPHIDHQERWPVRRSPETDKAMAALYRFAAARFATGRSMLDLTRGGR
jgi:hypothetical protein